jgi:hypothetical protein
MNHTHTITWAGAWLYVKARRQARELGVHQAARNLRKQGAPIELALSILRTVRQA